MDSTYSSALTLVKKPKTDPWGIAGGGDGKAGYSLLRPGTDRELRTGAMYEAMAPGDVLVNHAGGGGWGDPFEREPGAVLADAVNEYVSVEAARGSYVVVDPATWTVDGGSDRQAALEAAAGGRMTVSPRPRMP